MAQIEKIGSKRVVVGAHYGLRDWLAQRATRRDHGDLHDHFAGLVFRGSRFFV